MCDDDQIIFEDDQYGCMPHIINHNVPDDFVNPHASKDHNDSIHKIKKLGVGLWVNTTSAHWKKPEFGQVGRLKRCVSELVEVVIDQSEVDKTQYLNTAKKEVHTTPLISSSLEVVLDPALKVKVEVGKTAKVKRPRLRCTIPKNASRIPIPDILAPSDLDRVAQASVQPTTACQVPDLPNVSYVDKPAQASTQLISPPASDAPECSPATDLEPGTTVIPSMLMYTGSKISHEMRSGGLVSWKTKLPLRRADSGRAQGVHTQLKTRSHTPPIIIAQYLTPVPTEMDLVGYSRAGAKDLATSLLSHAYDVDPSSMGNTNETFIDTHTNEEHHKDLSDTVELEFESECLFALTSHLIAEIAEGHYLRKSRYPLFFHLRMLFNNVMVV
ncbi:hypothetical protein YB2330_000803 [Saitoella coloradoensis]